MIERGSTWPSGRPKRFDSEPAAMLRQITSRGMISTSLMSCSRRFSRLMKWVWMPIAPRRVMTYSLMRLLITPLPSSEAFFLPSNAVASSLKYWIRVPGSGPS